MLKKICEAFHPNPFDTLLKKAASENKSRFLIIWNRGLGDLPLGLYALVHRLRCFIPHASITFLTRPDLAPGFEMFENIHTLSCSNWQRKSSIDVVSSLASHHLTPDVYDIILDSPNPTKWLKWQIGTLTPKLRWQEKWDPLFKRYPLTKESIYIGVHVNTETGAYYGYEKNWPLTHWQELFQKIQESKKGKLILFGLKKDPSFLIDDLIDLRGETSLFEMLSVIKHRCRYLVLPDSGILSVAYYLDAQFPVRAVSLWADPKQGILRQKVPSPNKGWDHVPLIGKHDDIANISPESVYSALFHLG